MSTITLDPIRIVDLPILDRRHLPWRPLHELELEIASRQTAYTFTASPRSLPIPTPRRVNEGLYHIVRATIDGRRGVKPHRDGHLLLPDEAEAKSPDDFPLDPVGVAAWPWRRQIQLERWEVAATVTDGGIVGPLLLIGVNPVTNPVTNPAPRARAL